MKRHAQTALAVVLLCGIAYGVPTRGRFGSVPFSAADAAAATGWTSNGSTTSTTQDVVVAGTLGDGVNLQVGSAASNPGGTILSYANPATLNAHEFRVPGSSTLHGYFYPDATKSALITGPFQSENSKVKGTITLAAGTGTTTVLSGAKCVCGTETANPVRCSVATTTLTCTGTGTDACNYVCL